MRVEKWMCNHLKVNPHPVPHNEEILLLTLSHYNDIRYEYHRSLWHGPCCWHSCSLGVNAQDAPHCCLSGQQLHKNTKTGKIFTHPQCETLSEKCSLTRRGKCLYYGKKNMISSHNYFSAHVYQLQFCFLKRIKLIWKTITFLKSKIIVFTYILNILFMQQPVTWFAQYPLLPEGGNCVATLAWFSSLNQILQFCKAHS